MVILQKLQDFIGHRESSEANRFGTKKRGQENSMLAFGQEIESIMSGKRVNSGKKTGSQSVSEKSLKNGHHDTEEEPETQPVQQKQITFQLGVEGNIENPILVPKVTYKKK